VFQGFKALDIETFNPLNCYFCSILPTTSTVVQQMNQQFMRKVIRALNEPRSRTRANVRTMVSTILNVSGYSVVEAIDGQDAVLKFGEHRDEIDLVILDVVMPRKNGREACEWIRERKSDVKFSLHQGLHEKHHR
jgi:CheY-like chemotaxis protein